MVLEGRWDIDFVDRDIHVVSMCGVQINDMRRAMDILLMLGLNEAIAQLAMVICVHWY